MNLTSNPNRLPIVLSALVYPGLGQIFQRRWAAGTIYLLSFTVFFLMMMINVLVPLFKTLRAVLDFADGGANESLFGISPLGVLIPFGLSMLIYVANLLDVTRAARRRAPRPPPLPFP
jgi:hypothetical protein